MGRSVFHIEKMGGILERVTSHVMLIPRGRRLIVNNDQQKIVVLLEGQVKAFVNGAAVGDLGPGDALVIPGACKQAYRPLNNRKDTRMHALIVGFRRGVFACDQSLMRAMPVAGAEAEDSAEDFIRCHFGRLQVRRDVLTPAAVEAVDALRREAMEKGVGYRLRAAARALLLLTEIARGEETRPQVSAEPLSRHAWLAEQVKNFLWEHHARKLTLDQIARHLRLSAEHLARTFRAQTGLTIFGYIEQLRLERVKAQLAATELKVNEIAHATGFESASLLCRSFKRATGETPLSYRLRMARDTEYSPSVTEELIE